MIRTQDGTIKGEEVVSGSVTQLIDGAKDGDEDAANQLFLHLQETVRHVAENIMRGEPASHSLEASGLLNAALMRIYQENAVQKAPNRRYMYSAVIKAMRRVLIDHARRNNAQKRNPGGAKLPLDVVIAAVETRCDAEYSDLHQALERLGEQSPELLELVELRFLSDFTLAETAELLECSPRSVTRKWRLARAILYADLHGGQSHDSA